MSFKEILSSPYFWAFELHDLLATRSIWLKIQLHCIFMQEGKKLFEPQVDVWASSVWFSSSQLNHRSRTHLSPSCLESIHTMIVSFFFPTCWWFPLVVLDGRRSKSLKDSKTENKTGCNCNDTNSQVNFNVIVQFAAFYVFLQALGLVITQYWNSNSGHKTLTKNSDKSRQ